MTLGLLSSDMVNVTTRIELVPLKAEARAIWYDHYTKLYRLSHKNSIFQKPSQFNQTSYKRKQKPATKICSISAHHLSKQVPITVNVPH